MSVCGDSVVVAWDVFPNVAKYNVSLLDENNKTIAIREVATNYRVFKELESNTYKVKVDSSNSNGDFISEILVFIGTKSYYLFTGRNRFIFRSKVNRRSNNPIFLDQ